MPLNSQQAARAAEITDALRAHAVSKKPLDPRDRQALSAELAGLYDAERAPAPQIDGRVEALALRADTLSRALYGRTWGTSDRAILADALGQTVQQLPDGAWLPPALSPQAPRPPALLPVAVTRAFADRGALSGEALDTAIGDVERAVVGLDAPPAGIGAGGAA